MPIPFKIKVTKEILELSKACGAPDDVETIGDNCAIARAMKDIFPDAFVTGQDIYPFGIDEDNKLADLKITMPKIAQDFIIAFDTLCENPNSRPLLPEFEFDISIPDEIISQINIDEIRTLAKVTGLPIAI